MTATNFPKLWSSTTIGDIAEVVMGQSPPSETYNTTSIGLPFFQGKTEFGVESPTVTKWCPSPTRIAEVGDILLSVRAPVGPTNLANQRCGIGRGLAAIRAIPELADPIYLLYYFRIIEPELVSLGSGSTFSAVNRRDIETFRIPLPPLVEQRRIARIVRQADALIHWRANTNEKTKFLQNALFHKMFGDPDRNIKDWQTKKLGAVGELDRGRSRNRPRDAAHLYGGKYPFIQTGDIASSEGWITEYHQTYSEAGLAQSRLWQKGTLCITIAANIAKTGILTFDACFPDSVVGFTAGHDVKVEYVRQWFEMIQGRLEVAAPQLAQKNINLQILRDLDIPIPPLDLQEKFIKALTEIRAITETQKISSDKLSLLFQSISSRAFAGELTSNWREGRKDELQRAAVERDKALGIRGEQAGLIDYETGRVTPEEEEELLNALKPIAEKFVKELAMMTPRQDLLTSIAKQINFTEFAKIAETIANQKIVTESLENAINTLTSPTRRSLANLTGPLQSSLSITAKVGFSASIVQNVRAGSVINIIANIIERVERNQEIGTLAIKPEQGKILTLVQSTKDYFSAESLSEASDLPLEDVRNTLELFQTLGLVMQVSIADEANSTPQFTIFAPTYRAVRGTDDARHNDLRALEPNLEEPAQ
jgi:type I restriction enzyme, S subunit